ncbi:MAG: hypothetical protein ACXAC8_09675 [Candidatus Hodarchaeales archaeon]|jgi:hypothetical protein
MVPDFIKRLEKIPSQKFTVLLTFISAILTITIFLLMNPVETALKTTGPWGVIDLEFAWTVNQVKTIFQAWGSVLIAQEMYVTFLDYGFLITYSTLFAGITLLISRRLNNRMQSIGLIVTIIPFVAALFDAIENLNLILMLSSPTNFPTFAPFLTSLFAVLKFGMLFVVIISWIIFVLWMIYQRFSA